MVHPQQQSGSHSPLAPNPRPIAGVHPTASTSGQPTRHEAEYIHTFCSLAHRPAQNILSPWLPTETGTIHEHGPLIPGCTNQPQCFNHHLLHPQVIARPLPPYQAPFVAPPTCGAGLSPARPPPFPYPAPTCGAGLPISRASQVQYPDPNPDAHPAPCGAILQSPWPPYCTGSMGTAILPYYPYQRVGR